MKTTNFMKIAQHIFMLVDLLNLILKRNLIYLQIRRGAL